jgi:non-specific protein-tyrosine kinase
MENAVGLTDVVSGEVALGEAIQPWGASLDVLPAGPTPLNPSEVVSSQRCGQLFEELSRRYDFVLIDTPGVLSASDAAAIAVHVDGLLLLVRYGRTRRDQLLAASSLLGSVKVRVLGVVLSMVPQGRRGIYGRNLAVGQGSQSLEFSRTEANVDSGTAVWLGKDRNGVGSDGRFNLHS